MARVGDFYSHERGEETSPRSVFKITTFVAEKSSDVPDWHH